MSFKVISEEEGQRGGSAGIALRTDVAEGWDFYCRKRYLIFLGSRLYQSGLCSVIS